MKANVDKSKLDFGVVKGAEKQKKGKQQEVEYVIKMANFGMMFANLIVDSKSEQEFLDKCIEVYNKCKPQKADTKENNKDENN